MISARVPDSPPSADKLQPRTGPDPFRFSNQDGSDLPGGSNMSSAARAPIQVTDGHDAKAALTSGRFSQAFHRTGVFEVNIDRPVFRNHLVGSELYLRQLGAGQWRTVQIQRGSLLSEVNRQRAPFQHLRNHC
jgi:hypothetical protein